MRAPFLTPQRHAKNLARRVEMQIAGDWCVVPSAHNLTMRYHALKYSYLMCHMRLPEDKPLDINASALIDAADMLFKRLHAGTVTIHGKKRPLKGDITKLQWADNLTTEEKILVGCFGKVTKNLAGSQSLRPRIGHCLFGYRVNHGEGTFHTVSPNRRHSSMILRLHRARRNDTALKAEGSVARWRLQLAGSDRPRLILPPGTTAEDAAEVLDLPTLEERQAINAQDPWSSVMHFDVSTRVIFPRLMGVRMCMNCPHCNIEGSKHPCQNKFGNNAMIMGGTAGMCDGLGDGVEHQGEGTPHEHGFTTFVTPYQHRSLLDIHQLLETGNLDVASIKRYTEHLHREDHPDHEGHQAALPELERQWKGNYKDKSNLGLCAKPSYLGADDCAIAWSCDPGQDVGEEQRLQLLNKALADARAFQSQVRGGRAVRVFKGPTSWARAAERSARAIELLRAEAEGQEASVPG